MKKILLLSTLSILVLSSSAQLFEISDALVIKDKTGKTFEMAHVGGLNEPQFSNVELNNDGLIDLVVFDRTGQRILTFLAQKNNDEVEYTYAPEYEEFFPTVTSFMITRDYNGDGKMDLWLYNLDSVYLYENKSFMTSGDDLPRFERIMGLRAYNRITNIAWAKNARLTPTAFNLPGVEDLDDDGDLDFVSILNAAESNLRLYLNTTSDSGKSPSILDFAIVDECFGGLSEDTALYINAECEYNIERYKKKHSATKTLLFRDVDGDGDKDLFLGHSEELTNPVYFLENGRADFNFYKDTFIRLDTAYFSPLAESEMPIAPGMYNVDIDQDGELDLIASTNYADTATYPIHQKDNVLLFLNKGTTNNPTFEYIQNDFLVGDMVDFGSNTAPTFGDLDGDGDMDMIVATSGDHYYNENKADYLLKLENIGTKSSPVYQIVDDNYLNIIPDSLLNVVPTLADLDADGDLDLYLGHRGGTIIYYQNIGTPNQENFAFQTSTFADIQVGHFSAPLFYDLNQDGVQDLILGNEYGTLDYFENEGTTNLPSFGPEKDSLGGIEMRERVKRIYIDQEGNDSIVYRYFANFGRSAPTIVKWEDGTACLAVGGSEGKVRIFDIPEDLDSIFPENEEYMETKITKTKYIKDFGSRIYPSSVDLNGDNVSDLVIGNARGGFMVMEGMKGAKGNISVSEYDINGFNIYPNPATNQITVYVSSSELLTYRLIDVRGRSIQTGTVHSGSIIPLSNNIVNGVYFLSLKDSKSFYSPQQLVVAK